MLNSNYYGIFRIGDLMLKKTVKLILIILLMITIFSFSSDNGDKSNKKSDGVIVFISKLFIDGDLEKKQKEEYIENFSYVVRKSAHFSIYFLLGLLVFSFMSEFDIKLKKQLIIAFLICFLYACSDEIHQLFISGRSGQISDVLLDTIGSSGGLGFYFLLFRKKLVEDFYEQKERIS